jgi:hypothetical protein
MMYFSDTTRNEDIDHLKAAKTSNNESAVPAVPPSNTFNTAT